MKTDEIINLELLDHTFRGGPPTQTGNHIKWDTLFIRVKPLSGPTQTGSA